jgi:DNA-binding transcriptional regulator/RsmH inhibitor MraZ
MKNSFPINLATLYLGQWEHTIDGSNRIMLPAEWRVAGAPKTFCVVLSPDGDHLVACSDEIYGVFLRDLREQTADKSLIPAIERHASTLVRRVSLDRFGRLPLPREFTTQAGIKDHGELIGRFEKFEVWPCGGSKTALLANTAAAAIVTSRHKNL